MLKKMLKQDVIPQVMTYKNHYLQEKIKRLLD